MSEYFQAHNKSVFRACSIDSKASLLKNSQIPLYGNTSSLLVNFWIQILSSTGWTVFTNQPPLLLKIHMYFTVVTCIWTQQSPKTRCPWSCYPRTEQCISHRIWRPDAVLCTSQPFPSSTSYCNQHWYHCWDSVWAGRGRQLPCMTIEWLRWRNFKLRNMYFCKAQSSHHEKAPFSSCLGLSLPKILDSMYDHCSFDIKRAKNTSRLCHSL